MPAIPATPRQRIFTHLMELLASEGLVKLAWLHRWMFKDENYFFVKMDFGRSFKPQGSDEELMKYGNVISDRMTTRGALPEGTDDLKARIDGQYLALLALFERHLIEHPYFLGGHPSAADYAIMGAIHAHLGRDPAGLHLMQNNAPRVFRWVEHMMVPEVQSPEFFDREIKYCVNDEVPETALAILQFIGETFGAGFVLSALAFNQAMERLAPERGHVIDEENDQPTLPQEEVQYQGETHKTHANVYHIWVLQRAQSHFEQLTESDQHDVMNMLGEGVLADMIKVPLTTRLKRVDNRLVVS